MKYIKKIKLAGASYNVKRIFNNYIMLPIARIFSNIKYILTSDLVELDALDVIDDKVHYLEDKLLYSLKDRLSNLESDVEDKCSEYQVEDVIYNQFGSVEDFITYDDINDVKDDIKNINETIYDLEKSTSLLVKNNDNVDEGDCNNISLVTIKNIDNLLQEVNTLHSLFNDLTQDVAKLSKLDRYTHNKEVFDFLVDEVVKVIVNRLDNNENV